MATAIDTRQSDFSEMDNAGISREHWKIMFISGFVGVFTFPFFMHWNGLPAAEGAVATVSAISLIVTVFMLPATKGKSLEELSEEPSSPAERAAA